MRPGAGRARRRVVAAGLASVAVLCGWGGAWRQTGSAGSLPRRLLNAVLPNLASAQAIGHVYLRAGRAAEASVERLMPLIFAGQPPAATSAAAFRTFIAWRVQRDFAEGAVVRVDGWMLSVTEARLCALAAVAAG